MMKGNQGLEALATLCNNASKNEEQEASMQNSSDVRSNHQQQQNAQMNTTPMPAPTPSSLAPYASSAPAPGVIPQPQGSFNSLSASMPALLKGFGASAQQQAPNLLAAAGGLGNNDSNAILQQYVQWIQQQQQQQAQQQPLAQLMSQASQPQYPFPGIDPSALLLAAQRQAAGSFQVLPTPSNARIGDNTNNGSMKPPQFAPSRSNNGLTQSSTTQGAAHAPILSRRNTDNLHPELTNSLRQHPSAVDDALRARADSLPLSSSSSVDKKMQKRAANRRSAQLSRKRKKQFIEELKEENDDLRRKEQILRSIPDLIVVFDSSGKLGFVSHSVSNFLQFTPGDLVGTSFWERLCENSVRLLKAAFMDALAARISEHETTPLGTGVWELRLQDKNGNFLLVTLNGVVHFSGEAPECVCSIRPVQERTKKGESNSKTLGTSGDSVKKDSDTRDNMKAGQSIVAGKRANPDAAAPQRNVRPKQGTSGGNPVSISDVDSGTSVVSTTD